MAQTSIKDELLAALGDDPVKQSIADVVTATVLEAKAELQTTEWETLPDGCKRRYVPFSVKFWPPRNVPDHLVAEYDGYDSATPKAMYVPPKREFELLSFCFATDTTTLAVGPTGCGKTLAMEYYAAICGRPCLRIDHTEELDKASVFGQVHITNGDTEFVPGMLVTSASAPTIVILDEVSRAPGGANMIYKRALDRGELFVPEMKDAGQRAIKPVDGWIICGTDNTKGDGEDMDKYPMSNVQDAAFRNAMGAMIEFDYLPLKEEEALITGMAAEMDAGTVKKLAQFSNLMHGAFKESAINTAFSPRQLETICKHFNNGMDIRASIDLSFVSFCAKSELSDVNESLRACFG